MANNTLVRSAYVITLVLAIVVVVVSGNMEKASDKVGLDKSDSSPRGRLLPGWCNPRVPKYVSSCSDCDSECKKAGFVSGACEGLWGFRNCYCRQNC